MEHQHICLLDHLCVAGSLGSEEQVGGNRTSRGRLGDDQRFELMEAGELLVDARVGVIAVEQGVGEFKPPMPLIVTDAGFGRFGVPSSLGGSPKVPPRHHVGEGIVIDRLVVFVGPTTP